MRFDPVADVVDLAVAFLLWVAISAVAAFAWWPLMVLTAPTTIHVGRHLVRAWGDLQPDLSGSPTQEETR